MEAINLTNSSTKNSRRELDYYPTPPEVTTALMNFLVFEQGVLDPRSYVWEPACGDGAMDKVIREYCSETIATDIRHTGYGLGGIDFLNTPLSGNGQMNLNGMDAIITNPPFNLSADFIERAIEIAPVVCMLLKSQYWHASKRTKLFDKHPPAFVLALNWRPDFMNGERGGAPTMECLWTVWIRGEDDTRYRILQRPQAIETTEQARADKGGYNPCPNPN